MGWSEEQTLNSSMPYIETAYQGRVKMLQAIGLISKDAPPETTPAVDETRTLTPALFDSLFCGEGLR